MNVAPSARLAESANASNDCAYCGGPLLSRPGARTQTPEYPSARYCCYGCRLLGEAGEKPTPGSAWAPTPWFKVGIGAAIAGQTMLLGLAVNLSEPEEPTRSLLHGALIVATAAVLLILGGPLLRSAQDAWRTRQASIDFLFLAGIGGALLASIQSTFTGIGAVYYEVVAVLLTVYSVGRTLGAQTRARALAEVRQLREAFDQCRLIQADGTTRQTAVVTVQPGDRVQVFAGEAIPVDGRIEHGEAFIRETPLTGEPFPVVRRAGDPVHAGSFSEDGELVVVTLVPGTKRRLDTLLAHVEQARESGSTLQAQADRVVRWFLPAVLMVAVGTFVFWTLHAGWATGLFNAMAVLLIACPCAMGLATPIALWNGLAVLASRGIMARHADLISQLANLNHIVFDKTGTLSDEQASLIDLATTGPAHQRRELLGWLTAVQSRTRHPVARAFDSLQDPAAQSVTVRSLKPVPARGVDAWVQSATGREVHLRLGQREFVQEHPAEAELLASLHHAPGDHLVYVEVDSQLVAIAAVRERLRDSAHQTLRHLQALGIESAVLTGDRPERATELGLTNVQGHLTPSDKARLIETGRARGQRIAFVGDGINDAPAMRAADVGIALEHGAELTTASADAVLYGGDLLRIPWAIALCRQVRDSIRSNLLFAATYNVLGVSVAAAGLLHPVVAALLMVVSSAIVSWRALRVTSQAELCCGPAGQPAQTDLARVQSRQRSQISWNTAYGTLFATQAPFIVWLGQLSWPWAIVVFTACLLGGWVIARFRTESLEAHRYADMTFSMLGVGNWGMLLGWWVDLGFAPVMAGVACEHCQRLNLLQPGSFEVPWMYAGMLLFGVPPMWRDVTGSTGWRLRSALVTLSAVGMVVGMGLGSSLAMKLAGPTTTQPFLVALSGMVLGMTLGMLFACDLGRALAQRFGTRWLRR
jgi:heavy metal translocating P-type ATPase